MSEASPALRPAHVPMNITEQVQLLLAGAKESFSQSQLKNLTRKIMRYSKMVVVSSLQLLG